MFFAPVPEKEILDFIAQGSIIQVFTVIIFSSGGVMELFLSTGRAVLRYIVMVSLTPSCANSMKTWGLPGHSANLYFQNPLSKSLGSDKLNVFTGVLGVVVRPSVFEAGACLNFQRLGFRNYTTRNDGDRIRTIDIILVMLNKTIVGGILEQQMRKVARVVCNQNPKS